MLGLTTVVLWTVIILPFTYCIYNFLQFYREIRSRAKHIHKLPGVEPHPLWGDIHEYPGPSEASLFKFMKERAYPFKEGLVKFWYGPFVPAITVFTPETVKLILKTSEPKPYKFGGYLLMVSWLGDGLLLSKGDKWARNRRLLTPAFHFDILKPYMAVNNQCTDILMKKLDEKAANNEYFDVFNYLTLLTLDVILRCAFSYDNDCQIRGESHPYVKAVHEMEELILYRLVRPWLYPDMIYKLTPGGRTFHKHCDFVHSVSEEIIEKRKRALEAGDSDMRSGRYRDFLDILLTAKDDTGVGLTDREIRDEVDVFLFAGHDTTASGISWTLYSLACNQDAQRKCQEEVDQILEGRDSDDILWEDLSKLKYTTLCIKEAMRLHTPVPFLERQTTKDMDFNGYFLPAGTIVDLPLYVLHHHPDIWENPKEYRPDRFLPENIQKKDSHAFVPFSAGPRNCIGQNFAMHEMKSCIARVMRRFKLTPVPNTTIEYHVSVTMKAVNGMFVKPERRNTTAAI